MATISINKRNNNGKNKKNHSVDAEIQSIKRQLAFIKPEMKYLQLSSTSLTSSLVNATPQIVCLNALSQGTGESGRIGDKARMCRLTLRVWFVSTTSLSSAQSVRVLVVREKTTLGSLLAASQYFDSSTPAPATFQRNVLTRDHSRFVDMIDSGTMVISPTEWTSSTVFKNFATPPIVAFEKDLPFNALTDYSRGNTGTVTDIETNGINLVVFTSNSAANAVAVNYSYTMAYMDN